MIELFASSRSNGVRQATFAPPADQNYLALRLPITGSIGSGVRLTMMVEQSSDGVTWFPVGGVVNSDVKKAMSGTDRWGNPQTGISLKLTEQVCRHDVFEGKGWAQSYELIDGDAHYHQLAFMAQVRVTINTTGPVTYGCEWETEKRPMPPVPIGRRSASLLGIFTGAETSLGTTLTTGSRTTTSGSLISVTTACDGLIDVATDSKSNSYTERHDFAFNGAARRLGISTNLAGTRGTSHTCTSSWPAGSFGTVGAQEWDGIAASPTYDTETATGTSTTPADTITPSGGAALVIGTASYDDAASTISVSNGTESQEVDDDNTTQVQSNAYKVAASGATTLGWTIGSSLPWGVVTLAVTEDGGAAGHPAVKRMGGTPHAHRMGGAQGHGSIQVW